MIDVTVYKLYADEGYHDWTHESDLDKTFDYRVQADDYVKDLMEDPSLEGIAVRVEEWR